MNIQNLGIIKLYPSCYGGLLSCEYYIKIKFEMDTLFSTDSTFSISVDFYEPFNIIDIDKDKDIFISNSYINKENKNNPKISNNIYNSQ